jgi:hypothetical protein
MSLEQIFLILETIVNRVFRCVISNFTSEGPQKLSQTAKSSFQISSQDELGADFRNPWNRFKPCLFRFVIINFNFHPIGSRNTPQTANSSFQILSQDELGADFRNP